MSTITAGVIVGRVLKVQEHPNATRIRLATVDLGDGEPVQIVFGGPPVVTPGSLVAVAPPGSRVHPAGPKIRRRRYRGEPSHGMLCSLAELGWDPDAPDQVVLLRDLAPGASLDGLTPEQQQAIVSSPEMRRPHLVECIPFSPSAAGGPQPEPAPLTWAGTASCLLRLLTG